MNIRVFLIRLKMSINDKSLTEYRKRKIKRAIKDFEDICKSAYFKGHLNMISIYTKDNCPACVTVKAQFTSSNIPFEEIKIGKDITREEFMAKYPTVRSVPYIVEAENAN